MSGWHTGTAYGLPRAAWGAVLVLALGGAASAQETGGERAEVLEPRTAATTSRQKSAEVYAYFVNVETNDRLAGAESSLCERVDLVGADGKRRPYGEFRFEEDVEAGFRPGEPHLRLVGLKHALLRGQSFLVTLHFESGGTLALDVTVQ